MGTLLVLDDPVPDKILKLIKLVTANSTTVNNQFKTSCQRKMEMIDIIVHPNPIKQGENKDISYNFAKLFNFQIHLDIVKLEISATWGDLLSKLESEYEATISLYITNSSGHGDEGFDNPKINIDHSTKLVDFGHYEFDCEVDDFEFDSSPTIIVRFGKHRKIIKSVLGSFVL